MDKTLFLKIIDRKIPAKIEFENDDLIAVHDINPQAPVHLLFVPKRHIVSTNDLVDNENDQLLIGKLFTAAVGVAKKNGYSDYRLVINCGEQAGQTIGHIHLHLLAGRQMNWPPG